MLNAILVANHQAYRKPDFLQVAEEIRRLAPDIRSYVAFKDEWAPRAMAAQLLRPSLSVMLCPSTRYRVLRGAVAQRWGGRGKIPSYQLMQAAGLPLPRWAEITPGMRLDPAAWGTWVVLKPARGKRGQGVVIARTEEVRYQPADSYPEGHFGRDGPMLAQRFIYTGPWPAAYRVVTVFGRPMLSFRFEMLHHIQPPLADAEGFADGQPRSVPPAARKAPGEITANRSYAFEEDLLALARRAHAVFGEVPMIGFDILRDATDGSLHIAEANQGSVWALSGDRAEAWRALGLDGYSQFGAIRVVAEAIVDATRRLAR